MKVSGLDFKKTKQKTNFGSKTLGCVNVNHSSSVTITKSRQDKDRLTKTNCPHVSTAGDDLLPDNHE